MPLAGRPAHSLQLGSLVMSTNHDIRPWQKAMAASLGAVATNMFTTPLDVIKTRQMTNWTGEEPISSTGPTPSSQINAPRQFVPQDTPSNQNGQGIRRSSYVAWRETIRTGATEQRLGVIHGRPVSLMQPPISGRHSDPVSLRKWRESLRKSLETSTGRRNLGSIARN